MIGTSVPFPSAEEEEGGREGWGGERVREFRAS